MTQNSTLAHAQDNGGSVIPAFVAGKNKVINGDFGIWQRGAGAFTTSGYTADRFTQSGNQPFSTTQQTFAAGDAPVASYAGTYYAQIALTASASTYYVYSQKIENARTFAGQTMTLSYWAKANANVTNTASYERSTNGATYDSAYATANTITTSWQRFSATFAIPSTTGMTLTSTSYFEVKPILIQDGAAHTINIWGVQAEVGPVATPFTTATGTLSGELTACKYYYNRITAGTIYGYLSLTGGANTTTSAVVPISLPIMRVAPTAIDYANAELAEFNGTNKAISSLVINSTQNNTSIVSLQAGGATGLTVDRPYYLRGANNAAGYVGLSAEL